MTEHQARQQLRALSFIASSGLTGLLQRKCACSQHTVAGSECEECQQKREGTLHRAAVSAEPVNAVTQIVHEVLSSSGQQLDAGTGSTTGYPGPLTDPLLNADTYTTLVMDLS